MLFRSEKFFDRLTTIDQVVGTSDTIPDGYAIRIDSRPL